MRNLLQKLTKYSCNEKSLRPLFLIQVLFNIIKSFNCFDSMLLEKFLKYFFYIESYNIREYLINMKNIIVPQENITRHKPELVMLMNMIESNVTLRFNCQCYIFTRALRHYRVIM